MNRVSYFKLTEKNIHVCEFSFIHLAAVTALCTVRPTVIQAGSFYRFNYILQKCCFNE